jgi:hypothetical protein
MRFKNIIFENTEITDFETFEKLPNYLQEFLKHKNGFIALNGGIQFRGCVSKPSWLSIENIWLGNNSLLNTYESLSASDIPFAQDGFGDQFIIRDNNVLRLSLENGLLENLDLSFKEFLNLIEINPIEFLMLEPFEALFDLGKKLMPGQLMSVYPPFTFDSDKVRSFEPISAMERVNFLKDLYTQIKDLPDGSDTRFTVIND